MCGKPPWKSSWIHSKFRAWVLFGSHKLGAAQSLLKCPPSQLQDFHRLVTRCENICDFNLQDFARSIGSRAFVWFIDLKEDSDRIKNHFDRFSTFASFVSTTPRDVAKNLLRSVRLWCVVNYHHSQHHFLVECPRRQREGPWPRQRLRWDPSKSSKKSNITERTEITSDKLLQILTKWHKKQSQLFSWLKLKLRSELWQVRCGFSRNLLTPGASQNCPAHVVTHCAMLWEAVAICLSNPIKSESNQNLIKLDMSCAFTFWCVPIYWVKKQNRPLWECANCSISCAKIQQHMAQPDKIEFHSSLLFIGWMHYVIANIAVLWCIDLASSATTDSAWQSLLGTSAMAIQTKKPKNQKTKKPKNQKNQKNKKNKITHPKGRGSDAECWVLSFWFFCFFLVFWFFGFLVFCFFGFLVFWFFGFLVFWFVCG